MIHAHDNAVVVLHAAALVDLEGHAVDTHTRVADWCDEQLVREALAHAVLGNDSDSLQDQCSDVS